MSDSHAAGGVVIHTHCQHPASRIAAVVAKCSDCCGVDLGDRSHEGYVPRDMGIGGGDYVEFRWCLDCGVIAGDWPKHPELALVVEDEQSDWEGK